MSTSKNVTCLFFAFALVLIMSHPAYALQSSMIDPNLQITLDYPDTVKPGENLVISTITKATSDQISNITLAVSSPGLYTTNNTCSLAKLAKDSTFGNNFEMKIKNDMPDGTFVVNMQATYFIKGLFDANPVKDTFAQAFRISVQSSPIISFDIQSPSNVFSGEPFSIKGTVKNQGATAQNLQIVVYSQDVNLDGRKSLLLSSLDSGKSSDFEFIVSTPKDLDIPTHATIYINGTYLDESNKTHSIQDSISMFARHRGMMEIGDANGIWLGDFFIAPVVGVGTIVSSAIGFFIFLWHYRNKKKSKKTKKAKS
ncbi:CARDB domain-containing protein [Nitrosotalea sinensis]|nr:CARDB domain-containing protein [Candidatus Nitrosotalea sinensis]